MYILSTFNNKLIQMREHRAVCLHERRKLYENIGNLNVYDRSSIYHLISTNSSPMRYFQTLLETSIYFYIYATNWPVKLTRDTKNIYHNH